MDHATSVIDILKPTNQSNIQVFKLNDKLDSLVERITINSATRILHVVYDGHASSVMSSITFYHTGIGICKINLDRKRPTDLSPTLMKFGPTPGSEVIIIVEGYGLAARWNNIRYDTNQDGGWVRDQTRASSNRIAPILE